MLSCLILCYMYSKGRYCLDIVNVLLNTSGMNILQFSSFINMLIEKAFQATLLKKHHYCCKLPYKPLFIRHMVSLSTSRQCKCTADTQDAVELLFIFIYTSLLWHVPHTGCIRMQSPKWAPRILWWSIWPWWGLNPVTAPHCFNMKLSEAFFPQKTCM